MALKAPPEAVSFGRYQLLDRLGEGGMAVVYRATRTGRSKPLVVKRIRPELSQDGKFTTMLADEARLSALLSHPGIVQVTEFGDVDGEFYLAMEEVDGFDLGLVIRRCRVLKRPMPIGIACYIIRQVALALAYAHALCDRRGRRLDVVHRDVSPSNIMVSRAGAVKLLDFGIAKATTQVREERTRTGMLKGKLTYMSPEQAEGDPIDHRADIFALGVVFWECLTLQRLFRGENDLQTLKLVRSAQIARPSTVRAEVDPDLDTIVLRMLARSLADRYANCEEVAAALLPIVLRQQADEPKLRRFVADLGDVEQAREAPLEDEGPTADKGPPLTAPAFFPKRSKGSGNGPAFYEIKGSLVRAYLHQIDLLKLVPAVRARVSPSTLHLLEHLPLPSTWLDASVIEDMINAVEALAGMDAVRVVTKEGQKTGLMKMMQSTITGLFRLFGTSPNTLLSRLGDFAATNVKGMAMKWVPESERAGKLHIHFPRNNIPRSAFVGFESGCGTILELCGVKGKVEDTRIDDSGCAGYIRVSW